MSDQERQDLDWLEAWIERGLIDDQPVPRDSLSADRPQHALIAENLGFVQRVGIAREVDCPFCDGPHRAPVRSSSDGGFEIFCMFSRWTRVSEDVVALVVLDRQRLVARLAEAAGGRTTPWSANGRLCILSTLNTTSGRRSWTLTYADGLGDPNVLSGVVEAIKGFKPRGILATPSNIAPALPLPKEFRIMRLRDLFHLQAGRLVMDASAALERLGDYKATPSKAGRSSPIQIERELWLVLRGSSDWPVEMTEQAKRILENWPDDGPEANKPGTIAGHISKHSKRWLAEFLASGHEGIRPPDKSA